MSIVVPSPVLGEVAGFLVVRNESERLKFVTAQELIAELARVREIERVFWDVHPGGCTGAESDAAGLPSDEYFTLMRRNDNGEIEEQEGFDTSGSTNVGAPFVKLSCVLCGGNPVWFELRHVASTKFECEPCRDREIDESIRQDKDARQRARAAGY